MFHKPKSDDEQGKQEDEQSSGTQNQAGQQQGLSIEEDPRQQQENKDDTQMAQDTTGKQQASDESQQHQQDSQNRQADIPAGAGVYRGSQQIPNAERMQQQPGAAATAPYTAAAAQQSAQNASQTQVQETAQGRRLVVGQGITMSGEIEACDHLVVEGTVEAALKGASVLEISETGVFYGSVEIDEAVIAGRFEGELSVNGHLSVRSTGSITGTIAYKELAVEAGAMLDGKISPLKGGQSTSGPTEAVKGEQKKAGKAKKGNDAAEGDSGESVDELPFTNEARKDSSAA
jgi:cytoskeletal protein CcmA (bactofilin family)